jgi:hypothetical protein
MDTQNLTVEKIWATDIFSVLTVVVLKKDNVCSSSILLL